MTSQVQPCGGGGGGGGSGGGGGNGGGGGSDGCGGGGCEDPKEPALATRSMWSSWQLAESAV